MSASATDSLLVSRVRKKFEKLEETCMERYKSREQRVVGTLNYCITALEQLQNWALFGIFPVDEENSEKYLGFVEQRFVCVVSPLRLFNAALQREQHHYGSGMFTRRSPQSPPDSPKFSQNSPRFASSSASSTRSSETRHSYSEPSLTARGSTSSPLNGTASSSDSGVFGDVKIDSLRDKISVMSDGYIEEGQNVRKAVLQKLQKCRKDMRTIYRWGHSSISDLQDVLDDSLSDELYFLVRGKMQRVLSTLSAFEEAGDQTEKKLSNYFQNQPKPGGDGVFEAPDFVLDLPVKDSPRYEAMDLRLNLEALELSPVTPRVGRGEREDCMDSEDNSTRGSTPEPPTSPRPKGLVNHPKITKDKLKNYALPSKFSGLRLSSPW